MLVKYDQLDMIRNELSSQNSSFSIAIDDVQKLIDEEKRGLSRGYAGLGNFNYDSYHTFDEYQAWQADFAEENSDIARKVGIYDTGQRSKFSSVQGQCLSLISSI